MFTSALSMVDIYLIKNASSSKMKTIIDQKLEESKRNKPYSRDLEIDKNMVIVNNPTMFTVGTSFEQHPPYPKLGNRVIHTNNHNPHIPFGRIGTVTGIYKNKIEVMFDESFIGASDLSGRCNFFRGANLNFHDIFNLSEWKSYVNTKKSITEKIKTMYYKKKRGERIEPHENIAEWDGKIDGFLLITQMMRIKQDMQNLQNNPEASKPLHKLKGESKAFTGFASQEGQGYYGNSSSSRAQQPYQPMQPSRPGQFGAGGYAPQQYSQSYQQIPQEQKFETNPKHKHKSTKAKKEEEEYVNKNTQPQPTQKSQQHLPQPIQKGSSKRDYKKDDYYDEYQPKVVQPPAQTAPKSAAVNLEDIEKSITSKASNSTAPIDAAELERQMLSGGGNQK